jgi:hypothetical protein
VWTKSLSRFSGITGIRVTLMAMSCALLLRLPVLHIKLSPRLESKAHLHERLVDSLIIGGKA